MVASLVTSNDHLRNKSRNLYKFQVKTRGLAGISHVLFVFLHRLFFFVCSNFIFKADSKMPGKKKKHESHQRF